MNEQDVKKQIDQAATDSQFNNAPIGLHTHNGVDSPLVDPINFTSGIPRYIVWRVLDNLSSQGVSTTLGGDFEMPFAGTISAIGAFVDTAGTTSTATFDVNKNGTTIMSVTKLTIDSTEKTTRTAATPAVLTTTTLVAGDIINVDIDAVQTTPAKGLTIVLTIT